MGRSCIKNVFFCKTQRRKQLSPALLCDHLQKCVDSKELGAGKNIHSFILVSGLRSSTFLTTKLVQVYADCDDIEPAYQLFDELPQPNVFACTAILVIHSRHGGHGSCFQSYGKTKAVGVVPDGYIIPVVIRACAQMRSLECGRQVHGDAWKLGSAYVLQVGNSLVDMYSKCGCVEDAWCVFDEMMARNVLSWNSLISGYVFNGSFLTVLEVLSAMQREGFEPGIVTWNSILDGHCQMGNCEEASKIF